MSIYDKRISLQHIFTTFRSACDTNAPLLFLSSFTHDPFLHSLHSSVALYRAILVETVIVKYVVVQMTNLLLFHLFFSGEGIYNSSPCCHNNDEKIMKNPSRNTYISQPRYLVHLSFPYLALFYERYNGKLYLTLI